MILLSVPNVPISFTVVLNTFSENGMMQAIMVTMIPKSSPNNHPLLFPNHPITNPIIKWVSK